MRLTHTSHTFSKKMSLLSKQDHDLAITALGIVINSEDNNYEDPVFVEMQQLLQWLKLQRQKLYGE